MRGGLAIAILTLTGCDGGDGGPTHATVDSFDQCHLGRTFAECRDGDTVDGEPVLGCDADRPCRWFTTGAVPREVAEVSSCPADDICCVNNWPFESAFDSDQEGAYALFYALDRLPWDRERSMVLTVTVDPTLVAPATPSLTCTGSLDSDRGPCAEIVGVGLDALDTPAVSFYGAGDFYGSYPVIEIDQADSAALSARVCMHDYTDVILDECPGADEATAQCASAGTLTIGAWPITPATPLHLEATFSDGSTLVADSTASVAP